MYFTAPGTADNIELASLPGISFMSYFPVFMDLREKPVLVVGGGKVAARKVRALLKAGARISVVAAELCDELEVRRRESEIEWRARAFTASAIEGARLAFAATDDAALNRAVYEAGGAFNVPVNVVDDAGHCHFISPAVVDRGAVQVAVSTGGASPLMARAVRSWIEALLPHGLGKVAAAAGRLRAEVGRRLSPQERRRAMEFLMDPSQILRWSHLPAGEITRHMRAEIGRRSRAPRAGKVFLVGAGPGRPELLTVRAVEVLQRADVVLHDRLVPPGILDQARRDAERIDVGKRAGDHHGAQARIHDLMVEAAGAGKIVVRLKGGDAFVFGRGGEELQHLKAHGIDYEVVPGITAALGCAAYAGIPLTHRAHAQQLTLATGHLSGHEYGSAGGIGGAGRCANDEGQTLVVYMGVKQAPRLRERLLAQGMTSATPAALVVDGTMDRQRVLHGTISTLPNMAAQVPDGAPGLFIIGEVAALGQELAWFGVATPFEIAA